MKKVFNHILAVLMAFVVLFTTMSFTVNLHYCGQTLVDYSFVNEAQSCGMQQDKAAEGCAKISKKSCCQDKVIQAEGQDDIKPVFHTMDFEQQLFVTTFFYSYLAGFQPEDAEISSFKAYSPPPLIRDVQTWDQVFRI
ncbi:MAG: hypothetical protein WBG71_10710 [Leeuwenhoekiella sp.]